MTALRSLILSIRHMPRTLAGMAAGDEAAAAAEGVELEAVA